MTDAPASAPPYLFCFGLGYTGIALARALLPLGWRVGGTATTPEKVAALRDAGIDAYLFSPDRPLDDPRAALMPATHILLSVPPNHDGDDVYDMHAEDISLAPKLRWLGYLSTTGVYGNRDGEWIDETARPAPTSKRGDLRLLAERQWQALYEDTGLPLHIFRLSGIYGPGRSALDAIRAGTARRIHKPGHVFNRIHIDDIVGVVLASMQNPQPGAIYNLADDEPAPSCAVIAKASELLGHEPPPLIEHEKADLAPIVRSFYKDNKRIRNDRIKQDLGVVLRHPDYRSGLVACLAEEDAAPANAQDAALRAMMLAGGGAAS